MFAAWSCARCRAGSSGSTRQVLPIIGSRGGCGGGFQPATLAPSGWPSALTSCPTLLLRRMRLAVRELRQRRAGGRPPQAGLHVSPELVARAGGVQVAHRQLPDPVLRRERDRKSVV